VLSIFINGHPSPSDLEQWVNAGLDHCEKRFEASRKADLATGAQSIRLMLMESHLGFVPRF